MYCADHPELQPAIVKPTAAVLHARMVAEGEGAEAELSRLLELLKPVEGDDGVWALADGAMEALTAAPAEGEGEREGELVDRVR